MSHPVERLQIVRSKNGRLEIRKQAPKNEEIKVTDRREERVRPVSQGKRR